MAKKTSQQRRKARQKKLAERKRKRTQARSRQASRFSRPTSLHAQLRAASGWPLMECLLTDDWETPGNIVQVLIARSSSQGRIAVGVFLVDLGCLGVKNAFGHVFESRREYNQLRNNLQENQHLIPADLDLVAKIIREGLAYASQLGFEPNPDYQEAALVLGEADPDACNMRIPLGMDGKPFFVAGPHDDVPQVIAQLESAVGLDGFHYLMPLGDPFDLDY